MGEGDYMKHILLVDDNLLNIKVANKILERFNANNITSLDNGFDCIDIVSNSIICAHIFIGI